MRQGGLVAAVTLATAVLCGGCGGDPDGERRDREFWGRVDDTAAVAALDRRTVVQFARDSCRDVEQGRATWPQREQAATLLYRWSPSDTDRVLRAAHAAYCPVAPYPG